MFSWLLNKRKLLYLFAANAIAFLSQPKASSAKTLLSLPPWISNLTPGKVYLWNPDSPLPFEIKDDVTELDLTIDWRIVVAQEHEPSQINDDGCLLISQACKYDTSFGSDRGSGFFMERIDYRTKDNSGKKQNLQTGIRSSSILEKRGDDLARIQGWTWNKFYDAYLMQNPEVDVNMLAWKYFHAKLDIGNDSKYSVEFDVSPEFVSVDGTEDTIIRQSVMYVYTKTDRTTTIPMSIMKNREKKRKEIQIDIAGINCQPFNNLNFRLVDG